MVSLDEFLANNPTPKKGPPCAVCTHFAADRELAETLREARRRPVPVPFGSLAKFLATKKVAVSDYQLRDHFNRHEGKAR